jgi:quercetin dioxygenase-like cupin family protein
MGEILKEQVISSLFTSDEVTRQTLAPDSSDFNASIVEFGKGVRNKFHHHGSDQILIVTEGKGKVVTASGDEAVVSMGDVIFAPAGESHWHGALDDSTFAHITVTRKGSETVQTED